jgi:hypothetical protein
LPSITFGRHETDVSKEKMNEWIEIEKTNTSYNEYFRKFVVDMNIVNDLFE